MGQSNQRSLGFFEEFKIERMTQSELADALKENVYNKKDFEDVLNNYKLYNENYKIKVFPSSALRRILKKFKTTEDYDILIEIKKEYVKIFHKYYDSTYKSQYGPFYDRFKAANDYDSLVKEQKDYLIYKKYKKIYDKKFKRKEISYEFSLILIEYIKIEENYEKYRFIESHLSNEFSITTSVFSENIDEKLTEYFNLLIEKENNEYLSKKKSKPKKVYYEYEDDDNYHNNSYDNNYDNNSYDNNSYDNSYRSENNYNYQHHNTSSGNYKNYNSYNNSNLSNNHNKESNQKQKVKVIMCYSCKGKNLCPLCGDKIKSRVSLGNLYAHSNCYNEGTCCLCKKKGSGNHVQSICSNCRKSTISKGLTGSARCFICRKLI